MAESTVINLEGREPTEEEFTGLMVCHKVSEVMKAQSVVLISDIGGSIKVHTMLNPDSPEAIEYIAAAMEDSAKKIRAALPKVTEAIAEIESKKAAETGGLH